MCLYLNEFSNTVHVVLQICVVNGQCYLAVFSTGGRHENMSVILYGNDFVNDVSFWLFTG